MSVNTDRWWSGSTWVSSSRAPADREGASHGVDDVGIPPLGDVRHGLERMHPPTLEIVREPTAPAYYDRRAPEYDDWYLGVGLFADRERPGFDDELARGERGPRRAARRRARSTSPAEPAS